MWPGLFAWPIIFIATLSVDLTATLEQKCHNFSPERCNNSSSNCSIEGDSVICCHKREFELKETLAGIHSNVTSLYVYNLTSKELALSSLWLRSELEFLTITDGTVDTITGTFNLTNITCLDLSGNGLSRMDQNALKSLNKLRSLDLSRNNLTNLPHLEVKELELDISGNFQIWCPNVQDLMKKMKNHNLTFVNKNTTFCSFQQYFNWFNSTDNVTLLALEELNERETQCLKSQGLHKCVCKASRIVYVPGDPVTVGISVDCSGQQLLALPPQLPENTISLNVSNNNISSLDAMSKEDTYKKIREFTADNNLISSITVLENTEFINNFSILSLRSNNLKSVPTYFLSNSFDRNGPNCRMNLGGNKLFCDCNTAQVLKVWLMTNKKIVVDYEDVFCNNYQKKVVDLDQKEVCVSQKVWTDYIYYIIAGEVTLLIFLVSKVSYDYWVFKTAGYLPWPASKMPKLPCDWVFET